MPLGLPRSTSRRIAATAVISIVATHETSVSAGIAGASRRRISSGTTVGAGSAAGERSARSGSVNTPAFTLCPPDSLRGALWCAAFPRRCAPQSRRRRAPLRSRCDRRLRVRQRTHPGGGMGTLVLVGTPPGEPSERARAALAGADVVGRDDTPDAELLAALRAGATVA